MHPRTLQQPTTPRFARLLLTVALICTSAAAAAQTIHRQLDTEGRVNFSDRPDTPITRRELAPLAGQTGPDSEIRGRGRNSSVAHSRSIDKREADRRLSQAMRERARGPDMQQGFPPVAELRPGDRRRARGGAAAHGRGRAGAGA